MKTESTWPNLRAKIWGLSHMRSIKVVGWEFLEPGTCVHIYIYMWYMIFDIWYMIFDIWYMIFDIWYIYIYIHIYNYTYIYIYVDMYIHNIWYILDIRPHMVFTPRRCWSSILPKNWPIIANHRSMVFPSWGDWRPLFSLWELENWKVIDE